MASLLGEKPKDTYSLLLKLSSAYLNGDELRSLEDGSGNQLPLSISSNSLVLVGQVWPKQPPTEGDVLVAGINNQLSWAKPSMPAGTESFQKLADSGVTLVLPDYSNGVNYDVVLTSATQILLPSVTNVEAGLVLAITVKIKQMATFPITWDGNGKIVTFDDPLITPAGSGKTTIYSFIHYSGSSEWLGGVIWRQA